MLGLQSFADQIYDRYRVTFRPKAKIGDITLLAHSRLSRPMRETLYRRDYEMRELDILRKVLSADDRVLEFGAGMGLLGIVCAKVVGSQRITSYEANPEMEAIIRGNYAVNGVQPNLIMAAIGKAAGEMPFHVRPNFWASSAHAARSAGSRTVAVPVHAVDDALQTVKPTLLIVDIEGGEEDLFDSTDLPGVSKLVLEVHPDVIGQHGVDKVLKRLTDIGFVLNREKSFERELYLTRS